MRTTTINAYYDEHGFQPILVFDGDGRPALVAAPLPGKRPSAPMMRRVVRLLRAEWPRVRILIRGAAHYCTPETLAFCATGQVGFIFGEAPVESATCAFAETFLRRWAGLAAQYEPPAKDVRFLERTRGRSEPSARRSGLCYREFFVIMAAHWTE